MSVCAMAEDRRRAERGRLASVWFVCAGGLEDRRREETEPVCGIEAWTPECGMEA